MGQRLLRPRKAVGLSLALVVVAVSLVAAPAGAQLTTGGESGVESYLARARLDPAQLRSFVLDLPKGGDLHSHLSGAVSTETLIRLAAGDGMCINTVTIVATFPPCAAGQRPAADAVTNLAFRTQVIGAWSMEGFQPGQGESGHDHFFNAFAKFGAVSGGHRRELLAEVVDKAGRQGELYMETMTTRQGRAVGAVADQVTFTEDFAVMRQAALASGGLAVAAALAETDADEAAYRGMLQCGTPQGSPGCNVTLRYIHQVGRNSAPNVVFTSMVYGFELAEADGRNVALNLVAPEDGAVALRDYRLHMQMLGYLRTVYPKAHITLHAGELTAAYAPPAELRYHIADAVTVGRAERIGHGVDIRQEDNWPVLMRTMAQRHVMVEVNLTSNAQILGVTGYQHPFPYYRALGVPVGLSTDDEGISRIDLTNEYQRAVTTYSLRYRDLKKMARTVVDHAFLPGTSLWTGPDVFVDGPVCASSVLGGPSPTPGCAAFLAANQKAALQWRLEAQFRAFEARYGS